MLKYSGRLNQFCLSSLWHPTICYSDPRPAGQYSFLARSQRRASSIAVTAGFLVAAPCYAQSAAVAIPPQTPSTVVSADGAEPPSGADPSSPRSTVASEDPDAHPEQIIALFPNSAHQPPANMDEIDSALGQQQVFSDLRTLQDSITDKQRPTANVVGQYSSQSDHLDISQVEASQDIFFAQGRSQARLGVQAIDYNPQFGPGITQLAVGGTGNYRISDLAGLSGELWLNQLRSGNARDFEPTYDVFLTLRPSDEIRIDVDTSRRLFDNIRSLQLELTATTYGGSIDFTPTDNLKLTGRGSYSLYSDDNRRREEEVEGLWRIKSLPIVEVGLRFTNFNFSRLLDNGYFNPRNYYSGEGMFRLKTNPAKRFTAELAGSAGLEKADPGGTKPLFKGSLQLAYRVTPRWTLDGELARFTSRQSTSSGFSRTSVQLGLHYRF